MMRIRRVTFLACLLALPLLASCARLRESAQGVSRTFGVNARDERQAMLNGDGDELPPPKAQKPRFVAHAPIETSPKVDQANKPAQPPAAPKAEVFDPAATVAGPAKAPKNSQPETSPRIQELEARVQSLEKQLAEAAKPAPAVPPPKAPVKEDPKPVKIEPIKPAPKPTNRPPAIEDSNEQRLSATISPVPAAEIQKVEEKAPSAEIVRVFSRPKRTAKPFRPDASEIRNQARLAYQRIVTGYKDSDAVVDARLGLAQMAVEDANLAEAVKQYEALVEARPDSPVALTSHLDAGRLERELGHFDSARRHFYAFADKSPKDRRTPVALFEAAEASEEEGRFDDALKGYLDVMRRFQDVSTGREARSRRADLLLALKRYPEALQAYAQMTSLRENEEDFGHAMLQTARIHIAEKRPGDARAVLNRLLAGRCSDEMGGEASYLLGQSFETEMRPLDAARAYAHAAETYPKYPKALEARRLAARQFASAGLNEHAATQYRKLLGSCAALEGPQRSRLEPEALLGLARNLAETGGREEARKTLAELHQSWPGRPEEADADLLEAELRVAEGGYSSASELLGNIARAHRGTPIELRALIRKAEIEERHADCRTVIETFNQVKSAQPGAATAPLDYRRAVYLAAEYRDEEALAILAQVAKDPASAKPYGGLALYQTGVIEQRRGRLNEAIGAYRAFVKACEKDAAPEIVSLLSDAKWKIEKLDLLRGLTVRVAEDRRSDAAR